MLVQKCQSVRVMMDGRIDTLHPKNSHNYTKYDALNDKNPFIIADDWFDLPVYLLWWGGVLVYLVALGGIRVPTGS